MPSWCLPHYPFPHVQMISPLRKSLKLKKQLPKRQSLAKNYSSQVEWGKHLVTVGGCNDCHTPKLMTPQGPIDDTSRMLSGYYGNIPTPGVDRKQAESKGYVVTADFTSWVGPWGVSYAANLTPDETGTGSWTEEQFMYAIKNLIFHGLPGFPSIIASHAMMPVKHYTDNEIKAIFAYIKTIKLSRIQYRRLYHRRLRRNKPRIENIT